MTDATTAQGKDKYQACLEYIRGYWDRITRHQIADDGTLIGLPRRYLCTNHDMFKELYYWDSYFMLLGLEGTSHQELIVDVTENVLYLMKRFGRIPNASRYYHLSRSQPPFLTSMIWKSYQVKEHQGVPPDKIAAWLKEQVEVAIKEYTDVWRGKKFPDDREVYRGLSRYYDLNIWHTAAEAESGWDMTPRFEDRCLDFIPVDLNCLLFRYERDFMRFAGMLKESYEVDRWKAVAEERRKTMLEVMWDEDTGFFYDYDMRRGRRSNLRTVAGFFPLWSRLATEDQARRMVATHLPFFETDHGIVTMEEVKVAVTDFSKQWAWPNGWAPLQWIVISGLEKYGYHEEALRISTKWLELVNRVFEANGVNFEKYNVIDGTRAIPDRYPDQAGFGWTNAIFARLAEFVKSGNLWPQRSQGLPSLAAPPQRAF